jgi:hypothetical protein
VDNVPALLVEIDPLPHDGAGHEDVGRKRRVEDRDQTLAVLAACSAVRTTHRGEACASAPGRGLIVVHGGVFSLQPGEDLGSLVGGHLRHTGDERGPSCEARPRPRRSWSGCTENHIVPTCGLSRGRDGGPGADQFVARVAAKQRHCSCRLAGTASTSDGMVRWARGPNLAWLAAWCTSTQRPPRAWLAARFSARRSYLTRAASHHTGGPGQPA